MFQIITDACCDVPAAVLDQEKIAYIPMTLELEGKEYIDDLGQTFDYQWFLECLKEYKQPATTQINIGQYAEQFRPYVEQGIPLLYVGFSSGLSGSYNSSLQAVALLKEEYENVEIYCVDTKNASLGTGMFVMQAAALQKAGKSIEETVAWLEQYKMHLRSWVTVNDLKHLERGGRISKAAAAVGSLLSVKPIIYVDTEGHLENVGKVRGRNKALNKIVEETKNELDLSLINHFYVAHSGDDEAVNKVIQQLKDAYPDTPITQFPLGPTIASHTGYGCIALFSMGKTPRK